MVTAKVRAKGRLRGSEVTSDPFAFPIKVCAGCLQQSYQDPALIAYEYPADIPLCSALSGVNPYAGDPCSPGQDALILCCGLSTNVAGTAQITIDCPGVFTGAP